MADLSDRLKSALADRYRIERELGSGGMATVYLAEDLKHHRKVAVKVLRPELAAALGAHRFHREIEIAANLNHPHILPLLDSGDADGFLYYVMPFVDGETLRDKLNRKTQLGIEEAVKITPAPRSTTGSGIQGNQGRRSSCYSAESLNRDSAIDELTQPKRAAGELPAAMRNAMKSVSCGALVALLAVGFQACAGSAGPKLAPSAEHDDPYTVTVQVENRNFYDANVYAFRSGYRLRLGRVVGKTSETFTFRWMQAELRMLIDFIGGGQTVSEKTMVHPGLSDNLRLIIDARHDRIATLRGR